MTEFGALVVDLIGETLRAPKAAARRLIAMDPPMEARWTGLLLVSVLALLETRFAILVMPAFDAGPVFSMVADPIIGIPVQILSLLLIAAAMGFVGRMFGGSGSFSEALLLVVWLEFMLTIAQGLQIVATLVLPPLGTLIAFAALGMFLWLLAQFTAALHGFSDMTKVVIGMVVSFIAIVMLLAVLFSMLGIVPDIPKG